MGDVVRMGKPGSKWFIWIFIILLGVVVLSRCYTIIPAGFIGVKELFGKVYEDTLSAGLHIINPLMNVKKMSIRTQELTESAVVPSREGLSVNLDVTLLFSLIQSKGPQLYKTIGPDYVQVVVEPQFRSVIRGTTASYDAKALYTSEREIIANEMASHLEPLLAARGIQVEKILLRSVTLPPILSEAIERKLEAEQQAEQMKFVLERQRRESERMRVEAEGIADFQKKVGEGLTETYLKWKGIEATQKLAESQNSKVVIIGAGKEGLPVILGGSQ